MLRDNKKPQTSVAVILILMFLFADLALPSAIPEWKELENTPTINRVISNVSPSADTYIDSFYPNDNFELSKDVEVKKDYREEFSKKEIVKIIY